MEPADPTQLYQMPEVPVHHGVCPHVGPFPVPGFLRGALSLVESALGFWRAGAHYRYGVVLDTRQAHEALGFEPWYRIEVRRAGEERRIDAVRCR